MRSKYGIAMLIALVACPASGPALAIPQTPIDIVDFAFQPTTATEEIGVPITWTNTGSVDHTVTFETLDIDSGSIASGQTFSTTLEVAGIYTYHCSIHPSMTGTINAVPQQVPPVLTPRLWLPISIRSQD
jgi:plastocyanin